MGFYLAYHGLPNLRLKSLIARLYFIATPSLSYNAPHIVTRLSDHRNAGSMFDGDDYSGESDEEIFQRAQNERTILSNLGVDKQEALLLPISVGLQA